MAGFIDEVPSHLQPALFYTPIGVYTDLFSSSHYCLVYCRIIQTGFHTTETPHFPFNYLEPRIHPTVGCVMEDGASEHPMGCCVSQGSHCCQHEGDALT